MNKKPYKTINEVYNALTRTLGFSDMWEIRKSLEIIHVRYKGCRPAKMSMFVFIALEDIIHRCRFFIELQEDNNLWIALYVG